ncbi:hypothetical protein QJS04_geneDACA010548 [Acorus gramineus]|uniref:Uncharacterized protein n=1 Tax=Acorus gramineus TaxID=55184 RepID=A0AAV9AN87_ACOGR|nr:hypothetical protein QJS04_geneDACA010548 [Acorus gramineus]
MTELPYAVVSRDGWETVIVLMLCFTRCTKYSTTYGTHPRTVCLLLDCPSLSLSLSVQIFFTPRKPRYSIGRCSFRPHFSQSKASALPTTPPLLHRHMSAFFFFFFFRFFRGFYSHHHLHDFSRPPLLVELLNPRSNL